jgi:hypothetical protein
MKWQRRSAAIAYIRKAGGQVYLRDSGDSGLNSLFPSVSDEAFACAYSVDLYGCNVDDRLLKEVSALKDLEGIQLSAETMDACDLRRLNSLRQLTHLSLLQPTPSAQELLRNASLTSIMVASTEVSESAPLRIENPNVRSLCVVDARIAAGSIHWPPNVQRLLLSHCVMDPKVWHEISSLSRLRTLLVYGEELTDQDLQGIRYCGAIQDVTISGERLTDTTIQFLTGLTCLTRLDLSGTQVTDQGVIELVGAARRGGPSSMETPSRGSGRRCVALPWNLQELNLEYTRISDASLRELADVLPLRRIFLGWTSITDAGMDYVAKISRLEVVSLSGTPITDEALMKLIHLTELERIHLVDTLATEEGIKRFRRQSASPNVEIISYGSWKGAGQSVR